MSKPESVKIDPWVGFPRQSYSIIDDDFCHEKAFVAKIAAKNDKATVNVKETVNSKKGVWSITDQVKLWFDLPQKHSFYAKIKSTDYIKLHYDFGIWQKNQTKWNYYTSINSNKLLKNIILKAGFSKIQKNFTVDSRFRINFQQAKKQYHWYERFVFNKDKYKFGLLTVFNLGQKIIQKSNLLISYTHNNQHSVYLRAENNGYRKVNPNLNPANYFDNIIVDYVNNIDNKSKLGIQASYDIKQNKLSSAQVVYQHQKQKTTFKIGVNNIFDVKTSLKKPLYKLESLATLITGIGITGLTKNKPSFKTGFQLNINL